MPFRPISLNPQVFNPSLYKAVRALWFSGVPETALAAPESATKRWFGTGSPEAKASFDEQCHSSCRTALESIGAARYPLPPAQDYNEERKLDPEIVRPFLEHIEHAQDPETPASTALSLFILLDQMPRNIFRLDQRLIYSHYDRLSRALAHTMVSLPESKRWDLSPQYRGSYIYRQWMYLPLMHSEHLEDHEELQRCMAAAEEDAAELGGEQARNSVQVSRSFEQRHLDIVKRFGRYPYRNEVMGRATTEEEQEWLKSGGETFGTG